MCRCRGWHQPLPSALVERRRRDDARVVKGVPTLGCVIVLVVAACSGPTAGVDTTVAPDSTVSPTTIPSTIPSTSEPGTDPTTPATSSTTTSTTTPLDCDVDRATEILDTAVALARLTPGGPWTTADDSESMFSTRTHDAATFTDRMAYDCGLRLAQGGDTDRLALVAWNDHRSAYVIQAADAPSSPYAATIRFQLFIEQPFGEWLDDQFVWAATMADGESIVIGTDDDSVALTAKAWQSEVPPFDDLPVTIESEQHGIDALRAAGARNASVAEPAAYDSTIGTIQFRTPNALTVFAVIGAADAFDPAVPIGVGESTTIDIGGVDVTVTDGVEIGFDLYETGWVCGTHAWRLYTGYGSIDELTDFTRALIDSLTCSPYIAG